MKGSGLIRIAGRALSALSGFVGSQKDETSTPLVSSMYGVRKKTKNNSRRGKFKRRTRGNLGRKRGPTPKKNFR